MSPFFRLFARSLACLTIGTTVGSASLADPNTTPRRFDASCNSKSACLLEDTLQVKRLVTDAPLTNIKLRFATSKDTSEVIEQTVSQDALKTGAISIPLSALLSDKIKQTAVSPDFWHQLAQRNQQNKLPVKVEMTGNGATEEQELTVDISAMWLSGALQLKITNDTCTEPSPCKLGQSLKLSAPALQFWLSANKADISKINLALGGTVLPALPKSALGESLRFALDRGLAPATGTDAWSSVLSDMDRAKTSTQVSLATEQGVTLSNTIAIAFKVPETHFGTPLFLLVAFFLALVFAAGNRLIRDPAPYPELTACMPYSLGKSQMMFWTVVVITSWLYLFIEAGSNPWNFNDTAMLLLGISSATALGASASNPELTDTAKALAKTCHDNHTAWQASKVSATRQTLDESKKAFKEAVGSKNWFSDVTSDVGTTDTGLHRLQNLAFTVLFGAAFIKNVVDALAMPVFPATALALLGISGGAYVGYKAAGSK